MSLAASVVITSFATMDLRTLKSIDRQSLPSADFEVLLLGAGGDAGAAERLRQLVDNRPNFRLVTPGRDAGETGRLEDAIGAARGRYVLFLGDGLVLGDQALERLCALADESSADVCFGKTSHRGARPAGADLFLADQPRAGLDDRLLAALPCPKLYRTAFLEESGLPFAVSSGPVADTGLALAALARSERVCVLADYAAFFVTGAPAQAEDHLRAIRDSAAPDDLRDRATRVAGRHYATAPAGRDRGPTPRNASAEWADGALEVTVELDGPADPASAVPDSGDLRLRLGVYRPADGTEWLVPDEEVRVDRDGAGSVRVGAALRPDSLAGGRPLRRGPWRLVLVAGHAEDARRVRVPGADGFRHTGMSGGTPVVCHEDAGHLVLDVGATRTPVAGELVLAHASVVETAHGTLLSAPVRGVRLPAGTELDGHLMLGELPVRATLHGDGAAATLSAFVSGLPGSYPLATSFSRGGYASAGASLEVHSDGTMSLHEARAPRAPETTATGAGGTPAGTATTVRAPGRLRGLAKQVPGATAVYRRLRG